MQRVPPIVRNFSGRLNYDDHKSIVPKEDVVALLNITREQGSGGSFNDDGVPGTVRGNRLVANENLPEGRSKVIGAKDDPIRNCVYYFLWNENEEHCIFRYNNSDRTITLVLQEPPPPEIPPIPPKSLDFQENKKIIHVDIVHRDEGDLLYWTDGYNPPRGFNVTTAIAGGLQPIYEFTEAAKRPPPFVPTVLYVSDGNIKTNNLKGKLFEFAYRFIYENFEKSTFSPLSASPVPLYDYDANLNPLSNNAINVAVNTGSANVKKIEVIMRYNIANVYSDYYLVSVADKSDLGLGHFATYSFNFANDSVYPAIDTNESTELFDWVPRRANAQCMPNGNYKVYGGILEGYANLLRSQMDVLMQVTYDEVPIPAGEIIIGSPTFSFIRNNSLKFTCTIGATVTPGDVYEIHGSNPIFSVDFTFTYTALLGDTAAIVAAYFVGQIDPLVLVSATDLGGGVFEVQYATVGGELTTSASPATAPGGGGFYDRIYKFGAKYRFGIVYFDEQGRTPGVQTYVGEPGSLNDFEVEIDDFNAFDTAYKRPVISITVQHLPPQWARSFSFVRTEDLIAGPYFFWKGDALEDDGEFFYIGIDNLTEYQADNPNWTASWTFAAGDRLKGQYQFNGANDTGWGAIYSPVLDYEVIGKIDKDFGGGEKKYLKVKKYSGTINPDPYDDRLVFQVYRPAQKTTESQQVYFEFGETYETVEIDGVWYHLGQTASVNPTWNFRDGDSYIRIRPGTGDAYLILDPNFSEYQPSALDSNGRAFIVDENAAELYNPTLVRFSEAFQPNTNINGLNRFYFENFDEYNRAYGDILKLDTYESYMKVGQQLRIGNVPVFQQMLKDQQQSNVVATSDRLLNQIYYYTGDFGVGTAPEAWARNNFASYFVDNIRGTVCRLSQDGITPLSILYKVNSWATSKLPLRTGNSKIYGVFNADVNQYDMAMEQAGDDPAFTMSFWETRNSFEGERSYQPEMMCCLGTLLITFKDGELYTHDSSLYNNFYGVQYSSYIEPVFNDTPLVKKSYNALGYKSNKVWTSPTNGNIYTDTYNSQTGLQQVSQLISGDFESDISEMRYAALLRDANSGADASVALLEGDWLNGGYIGIRFVYTGSDFSYLFAPYVTYNLYARNF